MQTSPKERPCPQLRPAWCMMHDETFSIDQGLLHAFASARMASRKVAVIFQASHRFDQNSKLHNARRRPWFQIRQIG